MARKVEVALVDDIDGTADETVTTIEFGLDGTHYEIDLTSAHADELWVAMQPWISKARRKAARASTYRRRTPGGETTPDGIRLADVRAWAKEQGHTVAARGRVPSSLIDSYRESTKKRKPAASKKVEAALAAARAKLSDTPEFSN